MLGNKAESEQFSAWWCVLRLPGHTTEPASMPLVGRCIRAKISYNVPVYLTQGSRRRIADESSDIDASRAWTRGFGFWKAELNKARNGMIWQWSKEPIQCYVRPFSSHWWVMPVTHLASMLSRPRLSNLLPLLPSLGANRWTFESFKFPRMIENNLDFKVYKVRLHKY